MRTTGESLAQETIRFADRAVTVHLIRGLARPGLCGWMVPAHDAVTVEDSRGAIHEWDQC